MVHRKKRMVSTNFKGVELKEEIYTPLSVYIQNKSADVKGDVLRNDTPVTFDTEDAIAEMEEQGTISSIGVCDPTVDFFDIVEKAGKNGEKAIKAQDVESSKEN